MQVLIEEKTVDLRLALCREASLKSGHQRGGPRPGVSITLSLQLTWAVLSAGAEVWSKALFLLSLFLMAVDYHSLTGMLF